MKTYREWYACDNYLSDALPWLERDGHPATGLSWLAVFNPNTGQTATVTIIIYAEHAAQEPVTHTVQAAPLTTTLVELHRLAIVPRNQFFGLGVRSDLPIIPQVTHHEFRPWDLQPDATMSKIMYPGPLDETEWYFPDGWQGGGSGSEMSWYERETLTLLNPGVTEAHVTLTFFSYGHAADVDLWVAPGRIKPVALYDIPGLRFRWIEAQKTRMIDFSVRVTSDVPVVPQKTRRAYRQHEQHVQGVWTSFGCPYPLADRQDCSERVWYYPGGFVQDIGNYPRNDQDMLGWDLFFSFNPDPEHSAHCIATFCYEDADPQQLSFDIGPYRQVLHWLHRQEYRHLTGLNRPYAVRVESDRPLVPHFLRAEYESWDWNNPTAMFGVIPYEGPLTNETDWYIAEGFWQDRDDHPWVEQEWIAVFNPGGADVALTAAFYLDGEVIEHYAVARAGRPLLLKIEELGIVPSGSHYGIRISGDRPIVVQQSRRTFKKGGAASTLSTTATLGLPFPAV